MIKPPPWITEFNGYWLLTDDLWIRPAVEKCGRLAWDEPLRKVASKLESTKKDGAVIDVGAFIGDSAAWFNGRQCVNFEPQRDAFTCLFHNRSFDLNFPYPVGNGECVALDSVGEMPGNLGSRGVVSGASVKTVRLDDFGFDNVALIKIDVEGWEPNVLAGAQQTIAKFKPIVVCEFNLRSLEPRGFDADSIYRHFQGWGREEIYRYDDKQWDVMFLPR